jgi:Flp pilus assembly pilin Flp
LELALARACDDSGTVIVEYALVLSLLSLSFVIGMQLVESAAFAALTAMGNGLIEYGTRVGT